MANARRPLPAARPTAVAAVVLALGLTGCSATNPVTTYLDYSPSDGIDIGVGDVSAEGVFVLSSGEGEPGTLLGAVTNRGVEDAAVVITMAGSDEILLSVELGREETVVFGPRQDETVDIESVPAPPGALVPVTVTSDRGGAATGRVPVLDGTFEHYAPLVPEPDL